MSKAMNIPLPHKAYELKMECSAHTPEELIAVVRAIADDMDIYGVRSWVSSGTGIVQVKHDPEMTPTKWAEDLEAWRASKSYLECSRADRYEH